ncbi:Uncharacterised protein [Chromobacterium vaccinii]|nr:Uncharacterised protein [Chromobacterium vaccinii]
MGLFSCSTPDAAHHPAAGIAADEPALRGLGSRSSNPCDAPHFPFQDAPSEKSRARF